MLPRPLAHTNPEDPSWPLDDLPRPSEYGVPLSRVAAGAVRLESARRDISQEDLAELLGRSRSAISQRFTGKVAWSLDDLGTIAAAFSCPVDDLLDDGSQRGRR
ncbi:helix-turn-helix transcriptional regulator [Oerskovia enterophila]